mmetsp:Transcript_110700/g.343256  ORF Transcript_110700/g.343256 Transcript_110700/m.343256 type:complete len:289 (+) Transcript_110700:384-1250(+)
MLPVAVAARGVRAVAPPLRAGLQAERKTLSPPPIRVRQEAGKQRPPPRTGGLTATPPPATPNGSGTSVQRSPASGRSVVAKKALARAWSAPASGAQLAAPSLTRSAELKDAEDTELAFQELGSELLAADIVEDVVSTLGRLSGPSLPLAVPGVPRSLAAAPGRTAASHPAARLALSLRKSAHHSSVDSRTRSWQPSQGSPTRYCVQGSSSGVWPWQAWVGLASDWSLQVMAGLRKAWPERTQTLSSVLLVAAPSTAAAASWAATMAPAWSKHEAGYGARGCEATATPT